MKVIAQDWLLKPQLEQAKIWSYDKGDTGGYISDFKSVSSKYRVIGTREQIMELFDYMLTNYAWQLRGTYSADITDEYLELYKKNKNKPILLKL